MESKTCFVLILNILNVFLKVWIWNFPKQLSTQMDFDKFKSFFNLILNILNLKIFEFVKLRLENCKIVVKYQKRLKKFHTTKQILTANIESFKFFFFFFLLLGRFFAFFVYFKTHKLSSNCHFDQQHSIFFFICGSKTFARFLLRLNPSKHWQKHSTQCFQCCDWKSDALWKCLNK